MRPKAPREIARAIVAIDRALTALPDSTAESPRLDVVCLEGVRSQLTHWLRRYHNLELVEEGSILVRPIQAPLPGGGGEG